MEYKIACIFVCVNGQQVISETNFIKFKRSSFFYYFQMESFQFFKFRFHSTFKGRTKLRPMERKRNLEYWKIVKERSHLKFNVVYLNI